MANWALVTGSTSGIGKSFCELLAAEGYNLITVSRNIEQLNAVKDSLTSKFGIEILIEPADLSNPQEINRISKYILECDKNIEVIVNNAGFGINSSFLNSSLHDQSAMINCMVMAPMELTYAGGSRMKENSKGFIINVSSVAGYMAGSTYCSAKSWLNVFSESIHEDFQKYGINVHAICPGFTKTDFHNRCNQDVSGVPEYFWLDAEKVAEIAWKKVKKGKTMSIPAMHYKLLVAVHRFAPRAVVILYGKIAKAFLNRKI
jgi:short-subunit dehydrogenase